MSRLLSINNFHYRRAGSDALFMDHDELFRKHGWESAVFSMRHADNVPSHWSQYFVDELEFSREYSTVTRVRLATKVLYSLEARAQLRRLLATFAPDVVHLHSIYHHISPAILPLLGRLQVPVVLTAHDYKLACPAYKMYDGHSVCEDCRGGQLRPLLRKRCLHGSGAVAALVATEAALHRWLGSYERHVDRIICPSRFLLEKLAEWGWPRERLIHIRNFFAASLWQPEFSAGKYFLYFGRLAPEKGLATLLQAAAAAQIPLKVVGSGSEQSALHRLAGELSAGIELIEHLTPTQLAPLIRGARAVVLPSQWYENAPLQLLESMACGKPVIASRIGGIPEMVIEAVNGWLVTPGDVTGLAATLQSVNSMSDDTVQTMGRQARAFVEREYSSGRYLASMSDLYAQLRQTGVHALGKLAMPAVKSFHA